MGYEVVSLIFGGGLDTKTDPKMVQAPKVVLLQDAIFTNIKKIEKRPGYSQMTNALVGGGTWSSPTMVKNYHNELVLAAATPLGPRLISYSEDLNGWIDRGQYQSVAPSKTVINASIFPSSTSELRPFGTANSSCAVSGDLALYAFDTFGDAAAYGLKGASNATYITVVDLETGTHLADQVQITNALGFSKAVLLGTSTLAVFYITSTTSDTLAFRIVSVDLAGGVSIGAEVIVGTCKAISTLSNQFPYAYDVQTTSAGCVAAVADEPNLILWPITSSGSVGSSATITSSGNITPVSILADAAGNFWIYWISAGATLKYAIYSSSLSQVLAPTTITGGTSLSGVMQIVALNSSANNQLIFFSAYQTPSNGGAIFSVINTAAVDSSGTTVSAVSVYLNNYDISGKVFSVNGRFYLPIVSLSFATGATGFILDIATGLPVSKFLQTEAEGLYTAGYTSSGSYTAPALIGTRFPSFMNQVFSLSSTLVLMGAGFVTGNQLFTPSTLSSNEDTGPDETVLYVYLGTASLTFDFAHIDAYQGVVQQDTLALNGGVLSMYDGSNCVELGYNTDPDNLMLAATTGGNFTTGTLRYQVTFSWIDDLGNQYESAPSAPVEIKFSTGSSNAVNGQFSWCSLTGKKNVVARVWRTEVPGQGAIAFLCATVAIDSGYPFGLFNDGEVAGAYDAQPQLYTAGGAILENLSPPPSMILWTNNNRLWAVNADSPETDIDYTKTASKGTGIAFSTDQLTQVIDSRFGAITLGLGMDEKTVIGKQSGFFYFVGDGANDAGTGSTLSAPQLVPSDTGCSNSKSGILAPQGILFRASNNKGIYLFSRGVQIEYFGLDVNAYNAQDIQSVQYFPGRNQIRFLTSSGSSLLYDYVMQQWSAFTNHTGLSADIWQGNYVYVRTDGNVYLEDQTGQYLDNTTPYAPLIRMFWIKASDTQGFERVRRTIMLGDFQASNGGHGIQISAAYDFVNSFSAPVPYVFTGANGPYQYRERLARQKCDAIQLQIQEIVTGAAGEYISFNDLGIEILAKQGLNKLPGSRSVG